MQTHGSTPLSLLPFSLHHGLIHITWTEFHLLHSLRLLFDWGRILMLVLLFTFIVLLQFNVCM